MRYGKPSIAERLAALQEKGCDRILLVPLYPQYCAATTATVCDKAFEALQAHALAADACASPRPITTIPSISRRWRARRARRSPSSISSPRSCSPRSTASRSAYFDKGDPYYCHCAKTTRLLREALGLPPERLRMTFQSRFGRAEWLQPYTAETVKALASEGVKRLAVVTPGFAADCLETLEEIGVENAGYFHAAGGEKFAALPCLNDSDDGMRVLEALARRELAGWV